MQDLLLIKAQNRLSEMGKIVARILEKYNIRYIIMFGTLLGAVRHKGFIPWDDDFDISIFEEDYEKAINALRKELPTDLFLEDEQSEPLYFHAWAHVKDCNSIVIRNSYVQDNCYAHKGLSVDLYIMKRTKLSNVNNYVNREHKEYLIRRHNKGLIKEEEYLNRMSLLKEKEIKDSQIIIDKDRDVFAFMNAYEKHYIEVDDVLPLSKIEFEKYNFNCPNNYDHVLKAMYGDYMKLPPIEDRIYHFDSIEFLKDE